MTDKRRPAALGFHPGELAVQQQVGVQAQAARLAPMVAGGELRAGVSAFLAKATFAAITARDRTGRLWISPLLGRPGFLRVASPTRLLDRLHPDRRRPLARVARRPAGRAARHRLRHPTPRTHQRRPHLCRRQRAVDRSRAGLRQLPAIHSAATPAHRPNKRGRQPPACVPRQCVAIRGHSPRAGCRHVLSGHYPSRLRQ